MFAYYFLPYSPRPSRPRDLGLQGPDSITVLFAHILFDVFPKDYQWVVILLHTARWALDGGLEPRHNTPVVKYVLTLEFLCVGPARPNPLKTHGTGLGKVCTTLPVFDGRVFALRPVQCQGGTIHVLK